MKTKTHEEYEEEIFNRELNFIPLEKYVTAHIPILHECINGHTWKISPRNLLNNKGCPYCAKNKLMTNEEYISRIPDEYILLGEYINTKIPILHKHSCGFSWYVSPDNLLRGRAGCPKCCKKGFNPSLPGYVYHVSFTDGSDTYYKIGISNNSNISSRFRKDWKLYNMKVLWTEYYENGSDAQVRERYLLNKYKDLLVNTGILTNGNTETISSEVRKFSS